MRTTLLAATFAFVLSMPLLAQPVEPLKTDAEIPKAALLPLYQRAFTFGVKKLIQGFVPNAFGLIFSSAENWWLERLQRRSPSLLAGRQVYPPDSSSRSSIRR